MGKRSLKRKDELEELRRENLALRDATVEMIEALDNAIEGLKEEFPDVKDKLIVLLSGAQRKVSDVLSGESGSTYQAAIGLMYWCLQYYGDELLYRQDSPLSTPAIAIEKGRQARNALEYGVGRAYPVQVERALRVADRLAEVCQNSELLQEWRRHAELLRGQAGRWILDDDEKT